RFHTDSRSPKCSQFETDQTVSILGYDPQLAVQLRLRGIAHVHRESVISDAAWHQSTAFARRCYMAEAAPGTPVGSATSGLPKWIEGQQPTDEQLVPARTNFAVVMVQIDQIDWLHLANSGHRRAIFNRDDRGWHGTWCIP
ncbi:MAG: flavin-binding protein, partial [Sphingopyxis sp.]|nr:flavin-binding protein [Sphingopyxis sp.]